MCSGVMHLIVCVSIVCKSTEVCVYISVCVVTEHFASLRVIVCSHLSSLETRVRVRVRVANGFSNSVNVDISVYVDIRESVNV